MSNLIQPVSDCECFSYRSHWISKCYLQCVIVFRKVTIDVSSPGLDFPRIELHPICSCRPSTPCLEHLFPAITHQLYDLSASVVSYKAS